MLIVLATFLLCSQPGLANSVIDDETALLKVEQSVIYQPTPKKTAAVDEAKIIAPIPAVTFLHFLLRISHLAEKVPNSAVTLPPLGQMVVSFIVKCQTSHKASEDPHLSFC